jgi:SAM-dependent methyltransferase
MARLMRELQGEIVVKMTARNTQEPSYASGRSGTEVGPLRPKVVSVPDVTEDVLRRSGIERGMLALDLGCGVGDASLWIAKLVGPTGLVVGVDGSAEVIDVAQKRATVAGQCYWTRFVTADPNTFIPHKRFDVIVVRRALLLQGERATVLRLSACVRPDGVIIIAAGKPAGSADSNRHRNGALRS